MKIKSINKIKDWWTVTIFQNDLKTKQIILTCNDLEWLIDKIRIFMIEYRESRMNNADFSEIHSISRKIHDELKTLDF